MLKTLSVRFQICRVVEWHFDTSFVPSLGNMLLWTFEFDFAKNWFHLNLTVQNTGSPPPPTTFSAAGKQITTLGDCLLFVLFFLDFIPIVFDLC